MNKHPDTTTCRSSWINPVNIGTEKESWFCREHKVAIWPNRGTDMATEDSTPPQGNSHPPTPSSSLQDKLRAITAKLEKDCAIELNGRHDEAIAQIQAAYQEAHYYNLEGKQYLKDGTILPLYSGQEFYDRFKAELGIQEENPGINNEARTLDTFLSASIDGVDVIEAARRAAGCEQGVSE